MWQVFPLLFQFFQSDNVDYFTDMMPALHNYVTVDPAAFLQDIELGDNSRLGMVFEMCKAVMTADAGEDAECHAAKLLEVVLLQYKGQVDAVLPSFVELALGRLTREIRTAELRTMCLQVVIAALYYNPALLLDILAKIHVPQSTDIFGQFLKQWLHDCDYMFGLHDRKLSVLGICTLLDTKAGRPAALQEVAPQIMPALLMLFQGLARAYASRAEEEEDE